MERQHHLVCVNDFEREALKVLPRQVADYYRSGAGEEHTLARNKKAFLSVFLLPRVLRDVSKSTLHTEVLGRRVALPFGVAPTAMHRMAHPEGECATARAAGRAGTIFTLSTLSTSSLEEVSAAAPDTTRWFQLYIYSDRLVTKKIVQRAEAAGFEALVLTVDAPIFGTRLRDARNRFSLPSHLRLANFVDLTRSDMTSSGATGKSGLNEYVSGLFDQTLTWADLRWLTKISRLPLIVKGILCVEDAVLAARHGAKAVVVSNHGARQVDTVPATLEVLPSIARALKGTGCQVFLDGGVTCGLDVFKALALGAQMVFIGRPALWGLSVGGEEGVLRVLEIIKKELEVVMALAGVTSVAEISAEYVTEPQANLTPAARVQSASKL